MADTFERANQVWASDVTYLPMAHGFMYLVAILDVYSRKVLAHRLSNTLSADFCVEALQEALTKFGRPEIFNTDHVRSSPVKDGSRCWKKPTSPSAWMAKAAGSTRNTLHSAPQE